jgi:hypothetical protein
MTDDDITSRSTAELAEKYLALWNEPDADRRRRTIAELWTEDGRHIVQPPQEIRVQLPRPRRARPDRARLHVRRRLGGWRRQGGMTGAAGRSWVGLAFEDRERRALRVGDHREPPEPDLGGRQ